MLDWLVKIPGPEFLMVFIGLSIVCMVIGRILVGTRNGYSVAPDKNQLDPLAFAVLRGGWQAAVDITVVQLIERDIIAFSNDADEKTLYVKNQTTDLSPAEQVVYGYLAVPRSRSQFQGKDIQAAMEKALQPVYRQLEKMGLLRSDDEVAAGKRITYLLLLILDGLALIKIYFGVMYNKPVFFLVLLVPVVTTVLLLVVRPWQKVTSAGNRYLKDVTNHFAWLKDELANKTSGSPSAMNAVLGAAIFGVGILAFSELFSPYQVFAQGNRLGSSGSDSNWYSSDSGSSDSGSGDGGGSGCGGSGCGGCSGGGCGG